MATAVEDTTVRSDIIGPVSSRTILGMRVDATSYGDACDRILQWAAEARHAYVCVASVNNVMHSHDDPQFERAMNDAALVTPDGMPLVWGLRALGIRQQTRVYGPTLTLHLCERAAAAGVPVGFIGGAPHVLSAAVAELRRRFPALDIAFAESPPFRPLTEEEEEGIRRRVNESGVKVLFVGFGCPAQERWMAANSSVLDLVLVGVGAAFDFIAGAKRQAPSWLQRIGLEWLFRLVTEPRRLWRRYLYNNPRFVALFSLQLVRELRRGRR